MCAVVAVAGEAIQLPNNNPLELLFTCVGDHSLKVGAFVRFPADCAVDIFPDYLQPFPLGVGVTIAQLPFYALLLLAMGRIAGVYDRV
nr:MAG: hypothetical protein [Bacteriophage sp.]